jgi:hypothetical protein
MTTYAEKIDGTWIIKTPRQFMTERNASIPAAQLADYGLHEVTTDPRPAGKYVYGPIEDRDGLPVRTWVQQAVTAKDVNKERNRRLESDFGFMGKMFQRDTKSLQRITGAGTLAGLYMGNGGDPLSLKWHATTENPNPEDFMWIASDDTLVPMNAATVFTFSREAAAVETRLIFKAKVLRAMDPIPDDFKDDKWWT